MKLGKICSINVLIPCVFFVYHNAMNQALCKYTTMRTFVNKIQKFDVNCL